MAKHDTFAHIEAGGFGVRAKGCPACELEKCSCGNDFDGDNFCMPSACQWEGLEDQRPSAENGLPPIRPCCMSRHTGPVCPDGLVMCQLCFERVPIERLHLVDGVPENVCRPCAEREASHVTPPAACPDCGHMHTPDGCTGDPTPSDLWAGVSPAACDCDSALPPGSRRLECECFGGPHGGHTCEACR